MIIEEALYAELIAFAGLAALVGTRVYPRDSAPESVAMPFCQYWKVSGTRLHEFRGAVGMAEPRFQIDAFGTNYKSAKSVITQVRLALDGKRGVIGGVGGVDVAILMENEIDMGFNPDSKTHQVSADFTILHDEATS